MTVFLFGDIFPGRIGNDYRYRYPVLHIANFEHQYRSQFRKKMGGSITKLLGSELHRAPTGSPKIQNLGTLGLRRRTQPIEIALMQYLFVESFFSIVLFRGVSGSPSVSD